MLLHICHRLLPQWPIGPWLIDHIPTWHGYGMAPGSLDFSRRLVDACRWLRPFEERSLWIVNSHIHCMNLRAEAKSLRRRFPSAVQVSETFVGVPSWKLAQTGVCLSDLSRLMFIDIRSALQLNQPALMVPLLAKVWTAYWRCLARWATLTWWGSQKWGRIMMDQ